MMNEPGVHAAEALAAAVFDGSARAGDAVLIAQQRAWHPDVRRAFILFGDPATPLRR